jgi:hypothetical protein
LSDSKEKLIPYQKLFADGFIRNRLLEKPKTRGGVIYTILDHESFLIGGTTFLPTWDSTDHLHFVCAGCNGVADILTVHFDAHYRSDVKYALFFYLGCRRCGATGQRKMYLDRRPSACKYQTAYDGKHLYIYGNREQPDGIVDLKQERVEERSHQDLTSKALAKGFNQSSGVRS